MTEAQAEYQFGEIFERFEMASLSGVGVIQEGLDGLLASHILGAWTAFETMAADLWAAALNSHPATLAALKGNHRRLLKSSDSAQPQDEKKRSVPIHLLEMHKYDVANHMGSILRQRFDFDSLGGIREAYGAAFSQKSDDVDKALTTDGLDALTTLRNVLVHRAGVADKIYVKRSKHLPIPKVQDGEPILLDGEIVVPLVRGVLQSGNDLLKAVDQWLLAN